MNKEEIFNEISSCFKMSVDMNGMKKLEEYITNLQQQNQKYKEVIDKAIEYINENKDKYYQDWGQDESYIDTYLSEDEIKQLLEILKEVK